MNKGYIRHFHGRGNEKISKYPASFATNAPFQSGLRQKGQECTASSPSVEWERGRLYGA